MEMLGHTMTSRFQDPMKKLGLGSKLRLLLLYKKTQKYIDLLVDVQGHQMLFNGIFNGDPHPGNILALADGSLGLIDYGQTKSISNEERLGIARVVDALGNGSSIREVAHAMRKLGFQTKFDNDEVLARYATLFFDSDIEGKLLGCATPQLYFATLTRSDPLVNVPDVASKCAYQT
jgi:aarF domain-containing kinase